jgi:hypothetical protein
MTDRLTRLARLEVQARRQYDGPDTEPAPSLDAPDVLARLNEICARARRYPPDVQAAGRALWRDGPADDRIETPLAVREAAILAALDTARERSRAAQSHPEDTDDA